MSKVSKVIYGDTTVIDITDSTVNANNLLSGEKAYGADGEPVIGALTMGSTINVTAVDSSFYGETLSLTNGITTLSTTFDNSGDATFTSVIMTGLLTLTSNGLSQQISISSYGTYNITFDPVPEGATVTPTDDIQLWLRCAHITDKSYTTLSEVLADRATFETLIADSNACDYMARSTTWADDVADDADAMALIGKYDYCSNALLSNSTWCTAICNSDYFESVLNVSVPKMTSNTTPSGTVIGASTVWNNMYLWYAFDGNDSTYASPSSDSYIGYEFTKPVKVSKLDILLGETGVAGSNGFILEKYVNNSWVQILDESNITTNAHNQYSFANSDATTKYRITLKMSQVVQCATSIQFYGRASKEVLVPLVPTMTSDTTPSGVASADSISQAGYEAYRAFDNASSTTDAWISGSAASSYNFPHWIQYQFPTAQVVGGLHFKNYSTGSYGVKTFKVQGSNDGTTWTDLYSGTGTNAGGGTLQEFYFDNTTAYLYYRLYITEGYSAIQCGICYLQFLRTQSLTNIIHSSANDTIYYYENGSPIIIATTNSSGIGICDFSLLDNKVYTLYSTVAKDPSNLSNPYSKQVRITKSSYGGTTELYLMPDVLKTLYWYGYESGELEDMTTANGYSSSWTLVQPTHNTNNITVAITGHPQLGGVATPKMSGDNKFCIICSTSGTVTLPPCLIKTAVKAEPFDNKTATLINDLSNSTDKYFETSSVNLTNEYVATYSRSGYGNNSLIIKAFWYE